MSAASKQLNWGLGLGAERCGISIDLECSNGLKLYHSGCLNMCLFHM